jgi:hypothetical protein
MERYYANLRETTPEAILVKMADRLHNLRTISAFNDEKAIKYITETQNILYPIFDMVLERYPSQGRKLLEEMRIAISQYERSQSHRIPA